MHGNEIKFAFVFNANMNGKAFQTQMNKNGGGR